MNIQVVYYTRTRQTARFIEKLKEEIPELVVHKIETGGETYKFPYVLITPTYRFGNIPEQVEDFLENTDNAENIVAVVSSGNTNWGKDKFAMSGEKISRWMNVPWLYKYELRGNSRDLEKVKQEIMKLDKEKDGYI